MKRSVFVTGIAGSGKSTIGKVLSALGYIVCDMEDNAHGLFIMVRKDTGERYANYDNSNLHMVNNAHKVFNTAKLKELLDGQTDDTVFYCGVANDNKKVMPLFDTSILLRASPETVNNRLSAREGTGDFASTEAVRQRVLDRKDEFENEMTGAGALAVDANFTPEKVAQEILKLAQK